MRNFPERGGVTSGAAVRQGLWGVVYLPMSEVHVLEVLDGCSEFYRAPTLGFLGGWLGDDACFLHTGAGLA